jgi:hypothetical protein
MLSIHPNSGTETRPHPEGQSVINYDDDGGVVTGNLEGLVERLLRDSICKLALN